MSRDTRRQLAKFVATTMLLSDALEVDLFDTLSRLRTGEEEHYEALRKALVKSGLSSDEIATELATWSFVTVAPGGRCAFVHKSFRGYFVARAMRDHLTQVPHLLQGTAVEWEVLYFLGGFAPTAPAVRRRLWTLYAGSEAKGASTRRNLLLAFLYTQPRHRGREISNATISDAEFGHLTFDHVRMHDVTWTQCTVRDLRILQCGWDEVIVGNSNLQAVAIEGGKVAAALERSVVQRLAITKGDHALTLRDSDVDAVSLLSGTLRLASTGSRVGTIDARKQTLCLSGAALDRTRAVAAELRAEASIVVMDCVQPDVVAGYGSLFVRGAAWRRSPSDRGAQRLDARCIVVTFVPLEPAELGHLPGGVFGDLVGPLSQAGFHASAWGILGSAELTDCELRAAGDMLILSPERFRTDVLATPPFRVLPASMWSR